jgi:hypothetical protein
MPKVSRDSAPQRQEAGPVVDLRDELDGYTASFTSLLEDIDATPFMKGLRTIAASARIGATSLKGKQTIRYADRDEIFEGGDLLHSARPPAGAERARHRVLVVQPQRRAAHGRGGHDEKHAGDAGRLNALGEDAWGPHWQDTPSGRTAWACGSNGASGHVDPRQVVASWVAGPGSDWSEEPA